MINLYYYIIGGMHDFYKFKFKVNNVVAVRMLSQDEYSIGWLVKRRFLVNGKPFYRLEREFGESSEIKSACYEQIREERLVLFSEF